MQLTIDLPDEVAQTLQEKYQDLPRHVLEALAIEGYRSEALTAYEVRKLLGFESRFQVDAFFKQAGISTYTEQDFEEDRETLRRLFSK